ncbi:MarR family winged helix-turn-helix transcriptional regulator [Methylobacterium sp. ID0610]|uniref:MarR family winged helix-turn-helix transcriptional regulator n=1 Tax=Methylobacterium carpenticola TaxID=3344827 RepID=UPI0036CA3744
MSPAPAPVPPAETADQTLTLRAWLRLLTCTTLIENEIRSRLRTQFDFTLPRFDLLAQLDKAEDGLVLSEASKLLMVSAGNVTAVVEKLLASGYITRQTAPNDRRAQVIRLTHAGRAAFRTMAEAHRTWVEELFGDLSPEEVAGLMDGLARLKRSAQGRVGQAPDPAPRERVRRGRRAAE